MSLVNYFTVTLVTLVIKIVCLLVTIAYYTLAERKIMASVQRRLGPNVVGFWGLLQPVSDGLKLFGKELVIPTHANSRIFIFAPIGVLLCAFLGWSVIPFCLFDHSTGMTTAAIRECLVGTILGIALTPTQQLEKYWDNHQSQVTGIKLLLNGIAEFAVDSWRTQTEEHEKQPALGGECQLLSTLFHICTGVPDLSNIWAALTDGARVTMFKGYRN